MSATYKNKVIYNGNTLIDLTADTVTADKILDGYTAHDKSGAPIEGSCTFDSDTTDATALQAEILNGKSAYVNKVKLTGNMPNRGAVTGVITEKAGEYTVPQGYHDGSGKVGIDSTEQAKIVAENIRQGVEILGVEGSMTGTEDVHAESKTVTPSASQQTVIPTSPTYNYLSQVVVNAIPYVEAENSAGGLTVTIG